MKQVSKVNQSNQSENEGFFLEVDTALGEAFRRQGYIIQSAGDVKALNSIRKNTATAAAEILGISTPDDVDGFLNFIHRRVDAKDLNGLRLSVIDSLLQCPRFRLDYFNCARGMLESLVGNELAMQRNIGLNVQMPNDDGSLLPLHSDTWGSECSPVEVVLWIPLVDCSKTKSLFILPPEANAKWVGHVQDFKTQGVEELVKAIEPELTWIDIKYGEVLLFMPSLMHGNRVNITEETRWSFNVRFKGLFTPYSGKRLGEYFMPISLRPASRIGLEFEMPSGFDD